MLREAFASLMLAAFVVGCGDDVVVGRTGLALEAVCDDTLAELYATTQNPAFSDGERGELLHCARDEGVTAEQITARGLTTDLPPNLDDVNVVRIAYRTERLSNGNGPRGGISSAVVFLPVETRDDDLLVVSAHATLGDGVRCSSQGVPLDHPHDWAIDQLALAGAGWITIAPDYAGYGYGEAAQGYLSSEDEAHSVLDATRAANALFGHTEDHAWKVVLVGHSQGGHAVLSAHAIAASYGLAGSLEGVVAFAPMWFPLRVLGGPALSPANEPPTDDYPLDLARALWYFYGRLGLEAEPLDSVFSSHGASLALDLLPSLCANQLEDDLMVDNAGPDDFFEEGFLSSVVPCSLDGKGCDVDPAATWEARFKEDRPAVDPHSAPIVVWQGGEDDRITAPRAQCAFDKLEADLGAEGTTTKLDLCGDVYATHSSVVSRHVAWVDTFIAARAGLGPEPDPCPPISTLEQVTGKVVCPFPED